MNKPVAPLSNMARVFSPARCTPMRKCLECGSISCKRHEETVAYIVGVGLGICGVSVADTDTLVNLGDTGGAAVRVFALGVESLGLRALLPDDEGEGGEINETDTGTLGKESLSSQTGTSTERMENLLKPRYFFGFFAAVLARILRQNPPSPLGVELVELQLAE